MTPRMTQEITHYQGDTFIADGTYVDANDTPINLTGITITSYIRDRNNLKIDLTVTIGGGTGKYHIAGPTNTWPLGRVTWIIRYTDAAGVTKSSEPVVINVEVA